MKDDDTPLEITDVELCEPAVVDDELVIPLLAKNK